MRAKNMRSQNTNTKATKLEPIILATDPDEVMWASLVCAVVASLVVFMLTYA